MPSYLSFVQHLASRVGRRLAGRTAAARLVSCALLCLSAAACRQADDKPYEPSYGAQPATALAQVYVLTVHPLHSPRRLFEVYQPLVDHLNARLRQGSIRLEASASYAAFEGKLRRRETHLALPNPYQTLQAIQDGYRVFAKMGDDDAFRGIVLVRKDSGIREPRDLIGKAVSYPASTALAAAMMTQRYFHDHGVNVRKDLENRYVGTQESAIMNVALGRTSAGTTWQQAWLAFNKEHPREAAQLEIRWTTPPLLNNALVAIDDMPAGVVEEIERHLISLQDTEEGRGVLARMALSRFEPATAQSYEPVRAFIARFERDVRPVRQ